jgi:hypothetical protein
VGCHAQAIQFPSIVLFRELGQASLAVALVGFSVASRITSQALAFNTGVLDILPSPTELFFSARSETANQRKPFPILECI